MILVVVLVKPKRFTSAVKSMAALLLATRLRVLQTSLTVLQTWMVPRHLKTAVCVCVFAGVVSERCRTNYSPHSLRMVQRRSSERAWSMVESRGGQESRKSSEMSLEQI